MLSFGLDTTTKALSLALLEDERLLCELNLDIDSAHSQMLLPSIENLFSTCSKKVEDVDFFAWAKGPGSFTGLRIGLATLKGMAFSLNKPLIGVSSLKVLAMNALALDLCICPIIEARKDEIYFSLFETSKSGKLKAISKETALDPKDLAGFIKKKTVMIGQGARKYKAIISKKLKSKAVFKEASMDISRAHNVCLLGLEQYKKGKFDNLDMVVPNYHRKSQAEYNYKG